MRSFIQVKIKAVEDQVSEKERDDGFKGSIYFEQREKLKNGLEKVDYVKVKSFIPVAKTLLETEVLLEVDATVVSREYQRPVTYYKLKAIHKAL